MNEQALLFLDRKPGRGGGQVVLEALLSRVPRDTEVHVFAHAAASTFLRVPPNVHLHSSREAAIQSIRSRRLAIVANANSDFYEALAIGRALSRRGFDAKTVAIVHSYPRGIAREVAVRSLLREFDGAVVVEPGLLKLAPRAISPSWLAPIDAPRALSGTVQTGRVKSFARPDPSKGLHHLPALFRRLTDSGVRCEVALGTPLDGAQRYERNLRIDLAPWLAEGARTADWLDPGDVFVIPSISGEAACLSAQEALLRGAAVAASRLGLMPYLIPGQGAMRTFAPGRMDQAHDAVRELVGMGPQEFGDAVTTSRDAVARRQGAWYDTTLAYISRLHDAHHA